MIIKRNIPGVYLQEVDRSEILSPAASLYAGAVIEGIDGPVDFPVDVQNETSLVNIYGEPNDDNYQAWWNVARLFLYQQGGLGGTARVSRAVHSSSLNNALSVSVNGTLPTADQKTQLIKNENEALDPTVVFETEYEGGTRSSATIDTDIIIEAEVPGTAGDNISITVTEDTADAEDAYIIVNAVDDAITVTFKNDTDGLTVTQEDIVEAINSSASGETPNGVDVTVTTDVSSLVRASVVDGTQDAQPVTETSLTGGAEPTASYECGFKFFSKYPTSRTFKVALANATDFPTADIITGVSFLDQFEEAPTGTEVAIAILDGDNQILETFLVDTVAGNVDGFGLNNFIEDVLKDSSNHVLCYKNESVSDIPASFEATNLNGGRYVLPGKADLIRALDVFSNINEIDVNYMISHHMLHAETITLCENRQDCTFRMAAQLGDVVRKTETDAVADLVTYTTETLNTASTYGSFLGNAALIYDKYSRKNRWINLAGDMVGMRIRQNLNAAPFFADAGLNYGQFRNVIKLAIYPQAGSIRTMQLNKINPAISKPGQGIVKWGQLTFTQKKSALADENVRELAVLIWRTGKVFLDYKLFELNDAITRGDIEAKFNQFMASIQAARGVENYRVLCDETNNPPQLRQQNLLVVDVGFTPVRSISEITLRLTLTDSEATLEQVFA